MGSDSCSKFRLGIDIGGTFTDGVLVEENSGKIWTDKVLTTPHDPSESFVHCMHHLVEQAGLSPDTLHHIVHATTVASNALLERKGARAALLVTHGFRDILEIGRQIRHELYNLQTDKPAPLIPRERCIEISERLNYEGKVVRALDKMEVAAAAERLRALNVDSVAICFLHSYQNPTHEQLTAAILRDLLPQLAISLSSEVAPEIREYWRASTTVTNSYIAPMVGKYLDAIEQKLRRDDVTANVNIMQSSGGMMTVATARERPILMLESGPAAGVAAASYVCELAGLKHAISFDMGGTTAKMGLILDGEPRIVSESEAGTALGSGTAFAKGSGYPILVPTLDLVEVGAGGGSIAWIDSGGLMRVGPHSAGADPGPACYGRGGVNPTVTDANLVLGRLNSDYFLGGKFKLVTEAAREAIDAYCARPLKIPVADAAMGIVDIANATMVEAMRLVSVQRGYDPGEFCLIAFGGAGPVHANHLADELAIPVVAIPTNPGVASALGMLVSNLRHDFRLTRIQLLSQARVGELNGVYTDFEKRAFAALDKERVPVDQVLLERYIEMRYVGQSWKLHIRAPDGELTDVEGLRESFDRHHEQSYGYSVPNEPVEIVNIGLSAVGLVPRPRLRGISPDNVPSTDARKGSRPVYFFEERGFIDCPVFDRYALVQGRVIQGPAVVEEVDSSTIIHRGYLAEVAPHGTLLLQKIR